MEVMRSVCPYDCPDTCGLLVHVENGRAIKVEGDPDHPFTRGMLCPKMGHYEKTVHSKRRIVTPLLRSGSKGSGNFVEVSWDEAIERIAGNWKQIVNQHGAEAILPYSYAGTMGLVQRNAGHPFFIAWGLRGWSERFVHRPKGMAGAPLWGRQWRHTPMRFTRVI